MEKQLQFAPLAYLAIDSNYRIVEMNEAMRIMLEEEREPTHFHELLTVASMVYLQTYFLPAITLYGRVDEMFLTIKGAAGPIPVLMNAVEREGRFECAMMQMTIRSEYERELLQAKRNAEQINRETETAYEELQHLLGEVKCKKAELERLNADLHQLANIDSLTGLKNRRYLEQELAGLLIKTEFGFPLSLLAVDIDFFKRVNDTYGHQMGDAVLQELAGKLLAETEGEGTVARMGGEEFIILMPGYSIDVAEELGEKLCRNLEMADWKHVPITVSIGVTNYQLGDTAKKLFARVDKALYASKKAGRNCVTVG